MIRPILAGLFVQDGRGFHLSREFRPTSRAFNVQLLLKVCMEDPELGSELFYARACSAAWVRGLGSALPGFGYFVVNDWDDQAVGGMIQGVLDLCASETWHETRKKFGAFAVSEFEQDRFKWVRPSHVLLDHRPPDTPTKCPSD